MAQRPLMFRTHTSATSNASPEAVYDVIADLRAHLEWSGERASDDNFKLLALEAPEGPATVGTTFSSSGSAGKDTFHDRSVVTVASRPTSFVIETDARLDRKGTKPWEAHFSHRYDVQPDGSRSRIVYTDTVERVNYVPYWLKPWARPIFRSSSTVRTGSNCGTWRGSPRSARPSELPEEARWNSASTCRCSPGMTSRSIRHP